MKFTVENAVGETVGDKIRVVKKVLNRGVRILTVFFRKRYIPSNLLLSNLFSQVKNDIEASKMKREDWLLVYLSLESAQNKAYIDPIRIQKGLFLFGMENEDKLTNFYKFEPYLYGPCNLDIYTDLQKLQKQGLVSDLPVKYKGRNCYALTLKGNEKAIDLRGRDTNGLVNKLQDIKKIVTGLSFLELLKVIYTDYPKYATKSIVKAEALDDISGGVSV